MRFFSVLTLLSAHSAIAVETSVDTEAAEAAKVMRARLADCSDTLPDWVDAMSNNCEWYADEPGARCPLADVLASDAGDAEDVCCACGGGSPDDEETKIAKQEVEEESTKSINLGCGKCDDYKDFLDAGLSTCTYYETHTDERCALADYLANNDISANMACCACGGGNKSGCSGPKYIQSVGSGLYLAFKKHGNASPYVDAFPTRNILTKLEIHDLGYDLYAIKSNLYKNYMCVSGDGKGVTTCGTIGKTAKWRIDSVGRSSMVTIKSYSHGKLLDFVNIDNSAFYPVSLVDNIVDAYTKFLIIDPNNLAKADLEEFQKFEQGNEKNLRST